MNVDELLSSGIIEMYCMGIASDDEREIVEKHASNSKAVRDEIASISEALNIYAAASEKSPALRLRDRILRAVKSNLPPLISSISKSSDWKKYLEEQNIQTPIDFDMVHLVDLPGDDKQVTYIAWAKKGASIEESHEAEDEYLLMIEGKCSVTIEGETKFYSAGDIVFIPKNHVHRADALSDLMIVIGQRVAA
jgi:quercetin dioxygenase-like cupin family protein